MNIDLNNCYNEVCWLAAHNAFASSAHGWLYHQQSLSMDDQYNYGVRTFLIDVHWHEYGGSCFEPPKKELALMHSESEFLNVVVQKQGPPLKLGWFMAKVKKWLESDDEAIITLILESYTGMDGHAGLTKLLKKHNLVDMIYDQPASVSTWPTLAKLVETNKRLIIISSNWHDGYLHISSILTENHFDITKDPDGKVFRRKNGSLFAFNHFHPVSVELFRDYNNFNSFDSIMRRIKNSYDTVKLFPNF